VDQPLTIKGGNGAAPQVIGSTGGLIIDSGAASSISLKTNNGTEQFRVLHTATAVNFIHVSGAATAGRPSIGNGFSSDANPGIDFVMKGTASYDFYTRGDVASKLQFQIIDTASASRNITVTGSNGGNPILATSAGLLSITPGVLIGTATTNTNSTLGLTINQAGADNDILTLKSSDIAHGMTDLFETDSFGVFRKVDGVSGGLGLYGLSEAAIAIQLNAYETVVDTAKSTSANGSMKLVGALKTAATVTALSADANILVVANASTTRFILDAEGDSHQDVGTAWTNFDHLDDIATLDALSYNVSKQDDPIKRKFGEFLLEKRPELERHKLATFNEDGHHFVNMSKLAMLHTGAIRQLAERISQLEQLRLV